MGWVLARLLAGTQSLWAQYSSYAVFTSTESTPSETGSHIRLYFLHGCDVLDAFCGLVAGWDDDLLVDADVVSSCLWDVFFSHGD